MPTLETSGWQRFASTSPAPRNVGVGGGLAVALQWTQHGSESCDTHSGPVSRFSPSLPGDESTFYVYIGEAF